MEVVQSAMVVVEDAPPAEIDPTTPKTEEPSAEVSEIVADERTPDPVDTESE